MGYLRNYLPHSSLPHPLVPPSPSGITGTPPKIEASVGPSPATASLPKSSSPCPPNPGLGHSPCLPILRHHRQNKLRVTYPGQLSPGRSLCPQNHAALQYKQSQRQLGGYEQVSVSQFPQPYKKTQQAVMLLSPWKEGMGHLALTLSLLTLTAAPTATLARALATAWL